MNLGSVLAALAISATLLLSPPLQAASGPDDLYLDAYRMIQEADQMAEAGQSETARQRYNEAAANLKRIQSSYPNYSKNAVEFRLEYIGERVKALPAPRPEDAPRAPAARPAIDLNSPDFLRQRIARHEAENGTLQAKLQEALSAKPAAIDPGELVKAEERIKQLEKEKELLRVNLQQAQARQPQAADQALLDQARGELEATKKRLVETVATVATLTREKQQLQQELDRRGTGPADALKEAQARLAQLEQERSDLQARLAAATRNQSDNARIKDLEKERDALMKKLNDSNKELYDIKARGQAAQFETLTNQLSNLRARLEVFEARKAPFTPEELALMDKNVPQLAATVDPKGAKRTPRELPAGASLLVMEAERAFAARRFAEAEAKYQQVLDMDPDNPVSLANLAAIQLELQKLTEAEANLTKAVRVAPDDPYALSLLGMLRFQQGKFDEALDALTKSAQLDPRNAETQNYLGITLSQQGHRDAAEAALRKAVTLNPNYAGAHHNLAVIYATQRPPFLELAKYHYKKALALGQPENPQLEKQIGQ